MSAIAIQSYDPSINPKVATNPKLGLQQIKDREIQATTSPISKEMMDKEIQDKLNQQKLLQEKALRDKEIQDNKLIKDKEIQEKLRIENLNNPKPEWSCGTDPNPKANDVYLTPAQKEKKIQELNDFIDSIREATKAKSDAIKASAKVQTDELKDRFRAELKAYPKEVRAAVKARQVATLKALAQTPAYELLMLKVNAKQQIQEVKDAIKALKKKDK
jgi:hypothetical protein